MRRLTRLKSLLAISILCLGLLLTRAASVKAVADSIYLLPTTQTTTQGTTVSVTVHEDSGADTVNAVAVNLAYPTDKLAYSSISYTSSAFDIQASETAGGGVVQINRGVSGTPPSGDQIVAVINFKTIGGGTANITFGCNYNASTCPAGNALLRSTDNADILTSTTGSSVIVNNDHLDVGQTMNAGEFIFSGNVFYLLKMQGDGNLVLYGQNLHPMWASNTSGTGANHLVMQGDGNLVLYRSNNTPVWSSGTPGRGNSTLKLQDDGNLVLYTTGNSPTWSTNTGGHPSPTAFGSDRLTAGQTLNANKYLLSVNGRAAVLLQGDGNLVVYGPGYHVVWSSSTSGKGINHGVMQGDGNFVLYTSANAPVWATNTSASGAYILIQNDGNFVLYNGSNVPRWSSNTGGSI